MNKEKVNILLLDLIEDLDKKAEEMIASRIKVQILRKELLSKEWNE